MNLSGLTIGSLTLDPTFDSGKTSYTATTTNTTNVITATPEDKKAIVEIKNNGITVENGKAITWDSGENIVTATVKNGNNSKTYTVTVTKS